MSASCKNQKFGHNFPFPGSKCLNCGVNQSDLSRSLKKPIIKLKKNDMRTIHSKEHLLAKEISEAFNEKKQFALYLGIIKRIGFEKALQMFSEIKHSRHVITPAKLFMWKSSKKAELKSKNKK